MARKSKYQLFKEELEASQNLAISTANHEIATGTATYTGSEGTRLAGVPITQFYLGVPGIWCIDANGNHWCCGPSSAVRTPNT
jgi:hypothetical protein